VLEPWLDVDPDAVLPGRGRVADLLAALEDGS
jgi:7,8-dihydro-6-hydroxymethylpterin-pyrophosphokinase